MKILRWFVLLIFSFLLSAAGFSQDSLFRFMPNDVAPGKILNTRLVNDSAFKTYYPEGTEIYYEYGFRQLLVQHFTIRTGQYQAEIFDLKDPECAYGLFTLSARNCDSWDSLTPYACIRKFQVQFASSHYYVNLTSMRNDSLTQSTLIMLASKLLQKIKGEAAFTIPGIFTSSFLIPFMNDIKLIKGPLGIDKVYSPWQPLFGGMKDYSITVLPEAHGAGSFLFSRIIFANETDQKTFIKRAQLSDTKYPNLKRFTSDRRSCHLIELDATICLFFDAYVQHPLSQTIIDAMEKVARKYAIYDKMKIDKAPWGKTPEGKEVSIYTLDNGQGMVARITNYGGIVTSLQVPDKKGKPVDIVLGFDNLDSYLKGHPYFGSLIGRYGNRIANAKFMLNGKSYALTINNGKNHLHGGVKGFDKALWEAETLKDTAGVSLVLNHISVDGEEGYPGNLYVSVIYTLTKYNELKITYNAESDQPTPVNLTHHSYFNLKGAGNGDILDHELMIKADRYTVVDKDLIPTSELRPVAGTPFDFNKPVTIGSRIADVPGGYDHNFVLTRTGNELEKVATVTAPVTGIKMEVFTTEPGLQFYSGNFLDGSLTGKEGKIYNKHYGFCLEAQHFPDSPNQPTFPTTTLKPGQKYFQQTVYKFNTK
ncbi:MAG: galactose mutarotase [Bacteroidetes bacterium]|nr:galactose mutarotase [Bacteroidota bacterium]